MMKKIPIFVFLSAILEYFDYIVFPIVASQLMLVFFPHTENLSWILFIFYSLGTVSRIFGGVLFGYLSDRMGRGYVLKILALMMCIATLLIGLLPIGWNEQVYMCIFFILRLLQGLSFGSEMTSASIMVYEQEALQQNSKIGAVFIGATIGAILATSCLSLMQYYQLSWRSPFLFGGCVGLLSFLFRLHYFKDTSNKKSNSINLFKAFAEYKGQICAAGIVLLFPVSLTSLNLFFPLYCSKYLNISLQQVYNAQLISLCCSVFFIYLAAVIVDVWKMCLDKMYNIMIALFLIYTPFVHYHLQYDIISFMILWQLFIAFTITYAMQKMLNILPNNVNGVFSGFIYNMSFLIVSFIPMICIAFDPHILFYFPVGLGILALLILI